MSKIYDCFNFFNELDILEMRLNILYEVVDHFVIVESSVTHSGQPKPYYLADNMARFAKFADKIISYQVNDTPSVFNLPILSDDIELQRIQGFIQTQTNRFNIHTQPDYGRDFFQKECVRRALVNCQDDDIIIISDADEIPNPEILKNINQLDLSKIHSLNQYTYYYYLNMLKQKDWYGSKISSYQTIKNLSFNEVRGDERLSTKIANGGWHFSFMGGQEMVKNKLTSYSARDMVNGHVLSQVENNMEQGIDPFFRDRLTKVPMDETYPTYILANLDRYQAMIKE